MARNGTIFHDTHAPDAMLENNSMLRKMRTGNNEIRRMEMEYLREKAAAKDSRFKRRDCRVPRNKQ